ncbi:MAG: 16S rRNA (guanine(527)-N(7))-methyltransferase RsmG [Desulfobacterales bacterium]|nr:MAG: 16S rRNA (guanine(527)-N(7))-methyltransferase RsmG [Desulfobacterales bacterium]
MKEKDFSKRLTTGADRIGIELDERAVSLLYYYFRELKQWNRRVNLIAKGTDDETIVEKHFIDSLALLGCVDEKCDRILDVGSGAGFPGLVCRIARPGLHIDLAEPRLKRVSFLRHIGRSCRLDDLQVLPQRLEPENGMGPDRQYNCITCRAVADIASFLALCSYFRDSNTRIICMKGPKFKEELKDANGMMANWNLVQVSKYHLPYSGSLRALLIFKKKGNAVFQ